MSTMQEAYTRLQQQAPDRLPPWDEIPEAGHELMEACYWMGMLDAADYVDGNWADCHTMAAHLRLVAAGERPMYAE